MGTDGPFIFHVPEKRGHWVNSYPPMMSWSGMQLGGDTGEGDSTVAAVVSQDRTMSSILLGRWSWNTHLLVIPEKLHYTLIVQLSYDVELWESVVLIRRWSWNGFSLVPLGKRPCMFLVQIDKVVLRIMFLNWLFIVDTRKDAAWSLSRSPQRQRDWIVVFCLQREVF